MASRSKTAAKSEAEDAAKKAAEEEAAAKAKAAEEEAAKAKAAGEEAAKAKAGGKVQVIALQTIRCDGKLYKAGKPVPVSEDDAKGLVAAGVAER